MWSTEAFHACRLNEHLTCDEPESASDLEEVEVDGRVRDRENDTDRREDLPRRDEDLELNDQTLKTLGESTEQACSLPSPAALFDNVDRSLATSFEAAGDAAQDDDGGEAGERQSDGKREVPFASRSQRLELTVMRHHE